MKNRDLFVCLIASLIALLLLAINAHNRTVVSASKPAAPDAATRARIAEAYEKLPMSFEANRGQTNEAVKFLARGDGNNLSLAASEAVLQLRASNKPGRTPRTAFLRMKFAGANPLPRIEGEGEMASRSHYLIGNDQSRWRRDVPHYAKVRYREIYRGVDLVFYGNQRQIEYDFILQPGANPDAIKLDFEGADRMEIDGGGNLLLGVDGEEMRQRKPVVYQEINGERRIVAGRYVRLGKNRIGFRVAGYDRRQPLVIDPVLVYEKPLGGNGTETGNAVAVDKDGNAYLSGSTTSSNFPGITPAERERFLLPVYRSDDGAGKWERAGGMGIGSFTINTLVVDPKNSAIVYAAAREGVFKSTDGGRTWRGAGPQNTVIVFFLAIDPVNSQTIYQDRR